MHPASSNLTGRARDSYSRRSPQQPPAGSHGGARDSPDIRRPISDESWIEVASQPSSSSLSSAAHDEIITTGLRVTQSVNPRRRRRLHRAATQASAATRSTSGLATSMMASSQDGEYSASESGSEPAMASSGEVYGQRFTDEDLARNAGSDSASLGEEEEEGVDDEQLEEDEEEDDDDDDENATALGPANPSPLFTPQPNAFSHPPSARLGSLPSTATQDSYFPSSSSTGRGSTSTAPTAGGTRSARSQQQRPRTHVRTRSHTPYTAVAPSHSVPIDHDAALRASLSTLLSCAAAARGLPKRDATPEAGTSSRGQRVEPASLRLVSGAELGPAGEAAAAAAAGQPRPRRRSSSRSTSSAGKRKARSPRRAAVRPRRAAAGEAALAVSPTLMTWVLGASVMVLFSALSFSAGYALGREVGQVEAHAGGAGAMALGGGDEGWFGREGLRSRVWRWGQASGITT